MLERTAAFCSFLFFIPAFCTHSYTLCTWHPGTQTHSQSNRMWAQIWEAANTLKQKRSTWKFSTCAVAPLLLALSSDNALFKGCLRHLSDIHKAMRRATQSTSPETIFNFCFICLVNLMVTTAASLQDCAT